MEGGAVALLGMAGEIARVDLLLGLALQTLHRTGLCYGYAPQTELERQMAWAILEIAVAMTDEERRPSRVSTAMVVRKATGTKLRTHSPQVGSHGRILSREGSSLNFFEFLVCEKKLAIVPRTAARRY